MREDRSGGLNLNKSANSYANIPLIIHYVLINWEVVTSKKIKEPTTGSLPRKCLDTSILWNLIDYCIDVILKL